MIPRQITSLQHPLVKDLVKLRQERDFREQEKNVLIVGTKLVTELAKHTPLKILITDREFPNLSATETFLATPEILKKITGLQTPEGIAAVVSLPAPADLKNCNPLLILDGISDPGNVGTLLRTALGLGWKGVFLTPGSADPFNEKAIRAAKGATFRLPLRSGTWEELSLQDKTVFVADLHGQPLEKAPKKEKIALILGNETHGPSAHAKKIGVPISIPMASAMESLNVASAGAILMYALPKCAVMPLDLSMGI